MSSLDNRTVLHRTRRHPSAGNLGPRPLLLAPGTPPPGLPPTSFPHGLSQQTNFVEFGPDLDHSTHQRLLGNLEGRRVRELGAGAGAGSVAMARAGARVIAVEPSPARLSRARALAEDAEVRVEFHQADLADLAFLRADSVALCVSIYAMAQELDPSRVFRQVHRVLRPDGAFLLSLPHPVAHLTEPDDYERPVLSTPYPSAGTIRWRVAGEQGEVLLHPIAEVFTMLGRANFRVDTLAEPFPVPGSANSQHCHPARRWLPETVIFRGRKDGR